MADNFRFNFTSDRNLDDVVRLAFGTYRSASGYAVRSQPVEGLHEGEWGSTPTHNRLILFWSASTSAKDFHPLPFKMNAEAASAFIQNWLNDADYGDEPDQDGDNVKGFNIYNETWGHIESDSYAFLAVRPAWIMYGK